MRNKDKEGKGEDRSRHLRTEAEAKFDQGLKLPADLEKMSQEELIHELRVHQIELEMQNDELKSDQAMIEESRDKYAELYDFAPTGYLTLSRDVVILEANVATATLLGIDHQKLINQRFRKFIDPADIDRWDRYIVDIFQHDGKGRCELALKRPDGSALYVQTDSVRIDLPAAPGRAIETVVRVSISDITEHKRADERLKQSQNMLVQSKKLASIGRIVSEIAHQINNPLMIISCNAQLFLMSGGAMSAKSKDALELIVKECKRASDVMHKILKFARPSKGEIREVDICMSIEAVVSIIEEQFKTAHIEIKRNYPEKPILVSMDNQLTQEVFMNLLNNAKESMPDGGTITITASLEGDFFRIDFKDTGCGMSEKSKQMIFEPFFTTKEKGTGLGLSICYSIIKAHDGELKFESQLNKGSTATVLLPLTEGRRMI